MIKISWLPFWYPLENYASSRLRCLFHHQNINKYHNENFQSSLTIDDDSKVLIITQKCNNIDKVREFKKKDRNNIVIYDIVDNYYQNETVRKLFAICDYITVANETQEIQVKKHITKKVFVIPDAIDYENDIKSDYIEFNNNFVWFGNNGNINYMLPFIREIKKTNYNINLIGQCSYIRNKAKDIKCVDWNYRTFIQELRKHSVSIIGHATDQQQKSNNKLLVSIANGLPVISCNSKSYSNILKKFDLNYAIVNNRQDLLCSVEKTIENHKSYLKDIQPYILENFHSKKITEKLISLIDSVTISKSKTQTGVELKRKEKSKNYSIKIIKNDPEVIKDIKKSKILIYTANMGGYDMFFDVAATFKDRFDYLYLSDRYYPNKNWSLKIVDIVGNPFLTAKMYKILPHRFFPEYDISIWIDSSARGLKSHFSKLISLMDEYNLILPKHPSRNCLYDEAEVCKSQNKDNVEKINNQISRYQNECFPKKFGLYACGFMIRKHNEIIDFSEAWWDEIINNSKRDQISFPYVYNQYRDLVKLYTFNFKDCNQHFSWFQHGVRKIVNKAAERRRETLKHRIHIR